MPLGRGKSGRRRRNVARMPKKGAAFLCDVVLGEPDHGKDRGGFSYDRFCRQAPVYPMPMKKLGSKDMRDSHNKNNLPKMPNDNASRSGFVVVYAAMAISGFCAGLFLGWVIWG